jgi:deoxyhypusine synthase
MRRLLAYVIKNRFVDVLVLSGALVFHDLHETLGRLHYQAHPNMTDAELESAQIGRSWDVLSSQEEYREAGEWVSGFINQLDQTRPYSTREFLHLMGRELSEISTEDGILTASYKTRAPVFCPDISDSLITVGIAASRFEKKNNFTYDLAQDVLDMTQIATRARVSGIINIGSGSPRSFIQLTESATDIVQAAPRGHKYAIQIGKEGPHAGGFEVSTTNDDALIYGKLARGAQTAYVDCDATIALPFLVTALSQTAVKYMKGRKRPNFTFNARELTVEVP